MATADEIGSVGCSTLSDFFKAARSKREQTIRSLDVEFQGFKELSMLEQTYTRGDVEQMLSNYFGMLRVSLNKQFADNVENTLGVALDILEQADGKESRLDVNTLRYTSAHFERDMQELEQRLNSKGTTQLMPSLSKGVDPAKKLLDTREEGKRLQQKAAAIQQQFTAMMREKTAVQNELNKELDVLRAVKEIGSTPSEAAIQRLQDAVQQMEKDTAAAEAEAAGKINESVQFQNLKGVIQRKNEEIKALRKRLQEFEPDVKNDDDDE